MLNPKDYPFTRSRFFELLKEAVMFYPETDTDKLNTFAQINTKADFEKSNLGFDPEHAQSRYFYTKSFEKKNQADALWFDFPLLAAAPISGISKNIIRNNEISEDRDQFKLFILDTYSDDKETQGTLKFRKEIEVQDACRLAMRKVLDYLNNVHFYKLLKGVTATYGYYNSDMIDYAIGNGDYDSKNNGDDQSQVENVFRENFYQLNVQQNAAFTMPFTSSKLCGYSVYITISEMYCGGTVFNFNKKVKDLIYGACCV